MREIKLEHDSAIAEKTRSESQSITTNGWTSCANDSYMSVHLVVHRRRVGPVTLVLSCTKNSRTTTGDDLVCTIEGFVNNYDLKGRVVAGVTDCEPSMVKAGRSLTDTGVFQHVGCTNNGPGVKTCMALAYALVTCYTESSQAADRPAECCAVLGITSLKVVQDVEPRWWSTQGRAGRLVYLIEAIKLHKSLDDIAPLLSSVEWCVLRLLLTALDPLMYIQTKLEFDKVTGSLVVPLIWDLRTSLTDVLNDLREATPDEDDVSQARAMLLPFVQTLLKDFNSRWDDGSGIMTHKKGP